MSILDDVDGGAFSLRPSARDAHVESRTYDDSPLILRTVWRAGERQVTVVEALVLGPIQALVREVRAAGAAVEMDVVVRPSGQRTHAASLLRGHGRVLDLEVREGMSVLAPQPWSVADDGARCRFTAAAHGPSYVVLTAGDSEPFDATRALDDSRMRWREKVGHVEAIALRPEAEHVLGSTRCRELLRVAAAVLVGLHNEAGGIVAAPTTSLSQWPGSARCWDYRYCWLRDASLAAQALLRLGLAEAASAIGAFIGQVVTDSGVRPVVRVDGTGTPPERTLDGLRGYRGATPVRFGNAAADQLQIDVAGEVLALADELGSCGVLPSALAGASPQLAGWIKANWHQPDHGIWEIRGRSRRYTHSAVMAWAGLDAASRLAAQGLIPAGPGTPSAADGIRAAILGSADPALQLHTGGGGADAALSEAVATGFVEATGPVATATLDLIASQLADHGVLQRYRGTQDLLDDPCAPFVFPAFWLASAETRAGRDGSAWLRDAVATAGPLGLFGEVRDPGTGGPLGNYPQVQSHAALVTALVAPPASRRQ